MESRSAEDIRQFLIDHIELWNTRRKDEFLALWRAANVIIEDPVNLPARSGEDALTYLGNAIDMATRLDWKITIDAIFVCGNEAAGYFRNEGPIEGNDIRLDSIETFRFADDGSVYWRTYWEAPQGFTAEQMVAGLDALSG